MFGIKTKKENTAEEGQFQKPLKEKDFTVADKETQDRLKADRARVFNTPYAANVNARQLEKELKQAITGEVRFDNSSRSLYATDASNYRQIPIGVVVPKTENDIIKTIALCNKYKAPVLTRGGGTSLAGQCCNVAVVMDFSKYYNQVLNIDAGNKLVTVQTGIVLDSMRVATEREAKLTFGPDPATHSHCTIGGMLGNNSCGTHSIMARLQGNGSRTADNVETLTILTYDGIKMKVGPTTDEEYEHILKEGGRKAEIYKALRNLRDKYADVLRSRFPDIPRRVSGYNLPELLPERGFNVAKALVGSESTLVTILEATMQLLPKPAKLCLLVLGYKDIYEGGTHIQQILKYGPVALEGFDDLLVQNLQKKKINEDEMGMLPKGNGWILVEFSGDTLEAAEGKAHALMADLAKEPDAPHVRLLSDVDEMARLWKVRESGLGATALLPGEPVTWEGWEDSAVDPKYISEYLHDLRKLFQEYNYNCSLYGHFGDGCVHCRIPFDLLTEAGLEKYKRFTREAAQLVIKYNGSLSGEHGDGQSRGELLELMYGKEVVEAFKEFKQIWDPENKMNPGKKINSNGQTSNLRIGNYYNPPVLKTNFTYEKDKFSFSQATLRCVGIGNCRVDNLGTMCPSYMVTKEEEHSTRGRARLLYEMLEGHLLKGGWKNKEVKNALDLCLSCKGCKGDCPVKVDMATYKAEFLSHYYQTALRPRSAYVFGWIFRWARLASVAPGFVNAVTHAPVIGSIIKKMGGISQKRSMPKFAAKPFKQWFNERKLPEPTGNVRRVILWADTFNNFFEPDILKAGTEVLEAAGFTVIVPKKNLCCGRPLYDYGMLDKARSLLSEILSTLKEEIAEGIPVVGLEPSCVAVFKDELTALFHGDQNATRLCRQTFTLAEFLEKYAPQFEVPKVDRAALVHVHCHEKALVKPRAGHQLLLKTGMDFKVLDSGCCGMAGGFGYEEGKHYEVSVASGERILLPAMRQAPAETVLVADGFSCRSQIEQQTGKKPLHIAQVLQMALHKNNNISTD